MWPAQLLSLTAALCSGGSMALFEGDQHATKDLHTRVSHDHREFKDHQHRPRFPASSSAAAAVLGARNGKPLFPWHLESFQRSRVPGASALEDTPDDDSEGDDDDGHVVGYSAAEFGEGPTQTQLRPISLLPSQNAQLRAFLSRGFFLSNELIKYLLDFANNPKSAICDAQAYAQLLNVKQIYTDPMAMKKSDGQRYMQTTDDERESNQRMQDETVAVLEVGKDTGFAPSATAKHEAKVGKARGESDRAIAYRKNQKIAGDRLESGSIDQEKAIYQRKEGSERFGMKALTLSAPSIRCREATEKEKVIPDGAGIRADDDLEKAYERVAKAKAHAHGMATYDSAKAQSAERERASAEASQSARTSKNADKAATRAGHYDSELEVAERRLEDANDFDDWDDEFEPASSNLEVGTDAQVSVDASGEMVLDSSHFADAQSHLDSVAALEGGTQQGANAEVKQMTCFWHQGDNTFHFTVFVINEITQTENGLDIVVAMMKIFEGVDLHEYQQVPHKHHGRTDARWDQCSSVQDIPWGNPKCGSAFTIDVDYTGVEKDNSRSTFGDGVKYMFGGRGVHSVKTEIDELWRMKYVEIVYDGNGKVVEDGFSQQTEFGDETSAGSVMKPFDYLRIGIGQEIQCVVNKGEFVPYRPRTGKGNIQTSPDSEIIARVFKHIYNHRPSQHGWMYPSHGSNVFKSGGNRDMRCNWDKMKKNSKPDKWGKQTRWRCRVLSWKGKTGLDKWKSINSDQYFLALSSAITQRNYFS
jgi:hypothetical protein